MIGTEYSFFVIDALLLGCKMKNISHCELLFPILTLQNAC
jgi:hypothetical protein